MLDFILHDYQVASGTLGCALRQAGRLVLRADNRSRATTSSAQMMYAFENTTKRTGDAVWSIVKGVARKFGYVRRGYQANCFGRASSACIGNN